MVDARMTAASVPALLLIDVQQGLDDPKFGARNNPDAERNMRMLLEAWRRAGLPVIHVQHMSAEPDSPLRPGLPGNAIKPEVLPREDEPLFRKSVNSAFIGTTLEEHLRRSGIESLVIAGLTTDHCVSTTARMAGNLGFRVVVVSDATAAFERTGPDGAHYSAEQMHGAALASLHGEFGRVQPTREVLESLSRAIGGR
jgi:nicotinamidase-related amidase